MSHQSASLERIDVSPWTFTLIWATVAAFKLVCGTVLVLKGVVYCYMRAYSEDVLFSVELLGVPVRPELFPYTAAITLLIALIHLYLFVDMMRRSMRSKSLQFSSRFSLVSHPQVRRVSLAAATRLEAMLPPRTSCIRQAAQVLFSSGRALWKSFDVTSPNYGVVYVLREILQTGIQTQQAYKLSARVTKPWMNHAIVFLLVINCWAMPLILYGLKIQSTAKIRLLCVMINLILDFVSYFAFPSALFAPYARDYNYARGTYDQHFWYTDVWLIRLVNEWPLIFVTSVWDGFSRLFIAFTMTRSIRSIAKLLQPLAGPQQATATRSKRSAPAVASVSVVPDGPRILSTKSKFASQLDRLPSAPVLRSRAERWGQRVLFLWGLVVLALHVKSSSLKANPQCLVQVRPWFVRQPVCSLMELSCYDGRLTGRTSDFEATLNSIDTEWLAYLIIRHCGSVEITPHIRDLSWLQAVKIFNSTVLRWDDDAALTQTHHPNVLIVFLVSTNVSEFPRGLYHPDFPAKLMDIEVSDVNITVLPKEIGHVWHQGMFLVLEGLRLPAFPDEIAKLQPSFLSVACNNFSSIPLAVFESPLLTALNLNGNPIREIPSGRFSIVALYVVKTDVSRIPTWLNTESSLFELLAGSTPLCEAIHQSDASLVGLSSEEERRAWMRRVNCTPADEFRFITHYPLADEATNNPSRTSSLKPRNRR